MADIHALRFNLLMRLWEEANLPADDALPVLDLEVLEAWIRQSMSVDLDTLVAVPRSSRTRAKQTCASTDSVVAIVEPAAVLQMVEQMEAQPEPEQMIRQLAGEEDPTAWSEAIVQWLHAYSPARSAQLTDLLCGLHLSWVEVWLGLLLGGFELEQTGEFYSGDILIRVPA